MTGIYPDVPGPRMAYDRDGTVVAYLTNASTGPVTPLNTVNILALNDEEDDGAVQPTLATSSALVWVFPELRDLSGAFVPLTAGSLQTSANTTNGVDGTWTTRIASFSSLGMSETSVSARTNIQALSVTGVRAVKVICGSGPATPDFIHLYGTPSSGENPNRLSFWHPTLDQEITGAYFDWGDFSQGTTATRDFRIKNRSSTYTANSITVSMDCPSDTTPTVLSQHFVSPDGVSFGSSASAGTLAPGAISSVMTLKRDISASAVLSLWTMRLRASASSWT